MAEQHIRLLTALGLPTETITALENLPADQLPNWKPDEVTTAIRTAVGEVLKNDETFLNSIPEEKVPENVRKKVESGQYARFQNELLETAKSKLGLGDTDISQLSEQDKKSIKVTFHKLAEAYAKKIGGVEGAQELQRQMSELTDKLNGKDEEWKGKLDTEVGNTKKTYTEKLTHLLTRVKLTSLEGIELAVDAGIVTGPLLAKLGEKYAVVLGDDDELHLKQKANPQLDVMVNGKPLKFEEGLKEVVLATKVGKEAKEPPKPGERKRVTIGDDLPGSEEGEYTPPSYISSKIAANPEPGEAK